MSKPAPKPRQTDVRRRAVLPTTLQALQSQAQSTPQSAGEPADVFLDKMEEELNTKVDDDIEVLVEGLAELVRVAQVSPDRSRPVRWCERAMSFGAHVALSLPSSSQPPPFRLSFDYAFYPLLQIESKDAFRSAQDAFQSQVRTESM
ncbi:hypothetical protein P7C70_g9440, partial [Phenoliferia sp. Uapishka_3]